MTRQPTLSPDSAVCLGVIESKRKLPTLAAEEIRRALLAPYWPDGGGPTVFDVIRPGETVCFVVSDQTRDTAADAILPIVLNGLLAKKCSLDDMSVLIASGIHRPPTSAEIARILGAEAVRLFNGRVFIHDPDNDAGLVAVGTTRRGHVARVNRRAMEATRLVPIGAATYHYHAGFGGGRKSLVPGLASRETIAHNHSLTLDPRQDRIHPKADIGTLDGNPVAEEMLEAAYMCRPAIIINTVLTPDGKVAGVFSGEMDLAHRKACALVEQVCRVDIAEPADFVIASAEDAPNWIQSHKALYNAHRAVRTDGWVILNAPCPEGIGNERFRHWIKMESIDAIFKGLRQSSAEVLGQTALSTKMKAPRTILVTEMEKKDVEDLGIETASDQESAAQRVLHYLRLSGKRVPTYYLMPRARHTVPMAGMADQMCGNL